MLAWVFYVLVDSDREVNFPTLGDDFRNWLRILWFLLGFTVDTFSCIWQSHCDCLVLGVQENWILREMSSGARGDFSPFST